jgi:hypothetical protein
VVLPHENQMGTQRSPFFLLASRGEFGWYPRRFDHSIRSYATRADANTLGLAVHQGSHSLQIGKPTPLGFVVGVADIVSSPGSLATDFANTGHMYATLTLNFEKKLTTQQATYSRPGVQGLERQRTELDFPGE